MSHLGDEIRQNRVQSLAVPRKQEKLAQDESDERLLKEASLAVSLAHERRMSRRDSKATQLQLGEDAKQRDDIKTKLSKISSVNQFEKRGGKIMHYTLDKHRHR